MNYPDFKDSEEFITSANKVINCYNPVSKPEHYCSSNIECIDAMIAAYGIEAVKHFCICNAFKYLWRFNKKNQQQDIDKMKWYISKYEELNEKD